MKNFNIVTEYMMDQLNALTFETIIAACLDDFLKYRYGDKNPPCNVMSLQRHASHFSCN